MTGTIKKKMDKGYGFIDDGSPKNVFFHSKDLVGVMFDSLQEGAKVEFDVENSPKGPNAKNVKLAA